MKVGGLVFSARKAGNGFDCMRHCLDKLEGNGFETVLVNAFDYEIKPCSHCSYECYSRDNESKRRECPLVDDVPKMYALIKDMDFLLFSVPHYAGHISGLYKAWVERLPHIPNTFKDFNDFSHGFLKKIWGFIVIGNLTDMGDMTLHEALADFYNTPPPFSILLQANEYGRDSLKRDLTKVPAVIDSLDRFVELLIERTEKQ
jgi:multimeric flavodoxin WrbA